MLNEVISNLRDGAISFAYTKKDGSFRWAFGTLNHDLISAFIGEYDVEKTNRKSNDGYITYFDLEKMAFRKFKAENVLLALGFFKCYEPIEVISCVIANAYNMSKISSTEFEDTLKILSTINDGKFEKQVSAIVQSVEDDDRSDKFINTDDYDDFITAYDRFVQVAEKVKVEEKPKQVFAQKLDSNAKWCMQHNGGRGLNGVSLAAGGIVSSGYDCFGNPIRVQNVYYKKIEEETRAPKRTREDIIMEISQTHEKLASLYRELNEFK